MKYAPLKSHRSIDAEEGNVSAEGVRITMPTASATRRTVSQHYAATIAR